MSTSEIKALLDEQGRVFEAFKAAFDEKHGRNAEEIAKLNGELDRLADRIDETRAAMRRSARAETAAEAPASAERKAFAQFLRQGNENVGPEERKVLLLSDDTAGGYLAPAEMVAEIIKGAAELSPMRTVARVRQTSARTLEIPRRSGQFSAVWTGEIEARSETEGLAWGLEEIPTHELTAEVYLSQQIREDASGGLDAGFDTDSGGANAPTGWTVMRRLGSVLTDGVADIRGFQHLVEHGVFLWDDPVLDVDAADQGTSAVARTLSVPPGLAVEARLNVYLAHASAQTLLYLRPPASDDEAPSGTAGPLATMRTGASGGFQAGQLAVFTDQASRIESRCDQASTTLRIATLGWAEGPAHGAAASGGGGFGEWVSVDRTGNDNAGASGWDHAVDGSTAFPITFTGLGAHQDIRVIVDGVSASVSTSRALQVSVNNGASYFTTSGDYVSLNANGTKTDRNNMGGGAADSTAARSFAVYIPHSGLDGTKKIGSGTHGAGDMLRQLEASTSPINAMQIDGGTGAGGNATGGKIWVLVRR